ncbi:hypothetical protein [Muricoccus vinaceus]|uniref:Uncharacterized protein n=1 Tax=Muricoccus vinaceus TaxID=424704 RepID=A0ABV6IMA3_9PROT
MAKSPPGPRRAQPDDAARPRTKPAATRKPRAPRAASGRGTIQQGLARRAWGGGPSWLAVLVLVVAILVILPIAAAVLGEVWAVIIGALVGGFALGRATAR